MITSVQFNQHSKVVIMKFKIKTLNKTKNIELQNYRTIDSTLVLFMFISFNLSFSLFTND